MKVIVAILLVLLVGLQYRLWFGRGNLQEVSELESLKQERQHENEKLGERNRALAAEVLDLKKGLEAVEEKARSEMGMVKEGETFYQIVDRASFGGKLPEDTGTRE